MKILQIQERKFLWRLRKKVQLVMASFPVNKKRRKLPRRSNLTDIAFYFDIN